MKEFEPNQPAVPEHIDQMVLAAAARYGTPLEGNIYSSATEAKTTSYGNEAHTRRERVINTSLPAGEVAVAHGFMVETGAGLGTETYYGETVRV